MYFIHRLDFPNNPFYRTDLRNVYTVGYKLMRKMKWGLGRSLGRQRRRCRILPVDLLKQLDRITYQMSDPSLRYRRIRMSRYPKLLSTPIKFVSGGMQYPPKVSKYQVKPTDRKQHRCQFCGRYYHTEERKLVHEEGHH